MSWMTMDGQVCDDYGLHVTDYPARAMPRRKGESVAIPGGVNAWVHDGNWGYHDMALSVGLYLDGEHDAQTALTYLQPGWRAIVFGDDPAYEIEGTWDAQSDLETIVRGRKGRRVTVDLILRPYKTLAVPGDPVVLTAAGTLTHPGTFRALPKLVISGSGTVTVTLRGTDAFTLTGMEADKPVTVDSGAMICTVPDGDGLKNVSGQMAGDYPVLLPGANLLSYTGTVTKIEVTPRWAWLGR